MVPVSDQFTLLIDYAHNAMSLKSLLTTLREYNPTRLVSLFGCGGNRSKLRRFEMGEVSGNFADFTVITSDNPRFEEPEDIIEDIKTGIKRQTEAMWQSVTGKRPLPMPLTRPGPGILLSSPGKVMRITRKSKGSSTLWMTEY